jgi:hypothetical protein
VDQAAPGSGAGIAPVTLPSLRITVWRGTGCDDVRLRTAVHVYGAVAPLTGQTHYHISPSLSQGAFAHFLQRLLRYYRGKQLLVSYNGAEQHKGSPITTAVRDAE